jgi:two-component system OmpR family sensor kinase
MLTQPSGQDRGGARSAYPVAPTLDGLVMLRRSIGMDVRADVEPCLRAVGSPSTLAQVVTNLLANAERHAPGSPVRIAAARRDDRVEIRVRDFGPGVRPGRERAVLEPGTRDERAGGLGLGLNVCRTLLAAEDATIEILPADARSPGCLVVVGLPAGRFGPGRPGPGQQRERDPRPVAP